MLVLALSEYLIKRLLRGHNFTPISFSSKHPPKTLINEHRPRCQGDLSGDIRLGQAGCACVRYFFLGV